jgi:hypothetical protein
MHKHQWLPNDRANCSCKTEQELPQGSRHCRVHQKGPRLHQALNAYTARTSSCNIKPELQQDSPAIVLRSTNKGQDCTNHSTCTAKEPHPQGISSFQKSARIAFAKTRQELHQHPYLRGYSCEYEKSVNNCPPTSKKMKIHDAALSLV